MALLQQLIFCNEKNIKTNIFYCKIKLQQKRAFTNQRDKTKSALTTATNVLYHSARKPENIFENII